MRFHLLPAKSLFRLFSLFIISLIVQQLCAQKKTLGLTKHLKGGEEDGYVLFTPIGTDTTYLMNKCGQKLHAWYSQYTPGLSVYLLPNGHLLKTGTYTDTVFGFAGGRGGIIEEYDWDNNLVWRYKLFNDSLCQHHDITPLPNGNVLVLAWHSISKNEAIALGRNPANFGKSQKDLWGERILELKPIGQDSAVIVWQWDLFDHIIQDYDAALPNYGNVSQHPERLNINYALNLLTSDWIHANGLDYNKKLDQIVISCHNISEIWMIDHSTFPSQTKGHTGGIYGKGGDLLYRWGNPIAYDNGTKQDRKLFRQHNAQWIADGLQDAGSILLFNNGSERDTAYSTVDVIKTPVDSNGFYNTSLPYGPSSQSWMYRDSVPTNFYSNIISGTQRLPNGNTLICSGVQGRFFEVTPQMKTVWEYRNPVNANDRQSDGEVAKNNPVFRCVFYPMTYKAFKNKTLTPNGTVEFNSYAYSCNFETIPPKVVSLSPANNSVDANLSAPLTITFDEAVLAVSGNIRIYQNNTLMETIPVVGNQVTVNGKVVTINHKQSFNLNARIAVSIPLKSFRDSSNNSTSAIDSSAWHFTTALTRPVVDFYFPTPLSQHIQPTALLQIQFKENISKSGLGKIKIWVNNVLVETIPGYSGKIVVAGNLVTIVQTDPLPYNSDISVEFGPCFMDAKNNTNDTIAKGDWTFRTASLPQIVNLSPANKAIDVPVNTTLSISFDRPIVVAKTDNLLVYENNILKDMIQVNGPRAMINGNTISFDLNSDFKKFARISIMLNTDILKDTFGTYVNGIDSSAWHFTVVASNSLIENKTISKGYRIFPNPGNGTYTMTSLDKIESVEAFNMTGQKLECVFISATDNAGEVKLKDAAAGCYLLLINGRYAMHVIVQ